MQVVPGFFNVIQIQRQFQFSPWMPETLHQSKIQLQCKLEKIILKLNKHSLNQAIFLMFNSSINLFEFMGFRLRGFTETLKQLKLNL